KHKSPLESLRFPSGATGDRSLRPCARDRADAHSATYLKPFYKAMRMTGRLHGAHLALLALLLAAAAGQAQGGVVTRGRRPKRGAAPPPEAPILDEDDGPGGLEAVIKAAFPNDNGGAAALQLGGGPAPAAAGAAPPQFIVTFRDDAPPADGAAPPAPRLLAGGGAAPQRLAGVKAAVLSAAAARGGAALARDFSELPLAVVSASSAAAVRALASDPNVLSVAPDRRNTLQVTQSLRLISQPAAAAAGHTGRGCAVAVIDTGANFAHADLGKCTKVGGTCKVAFAKDFTAVDDRSRDDNGHGTNVAAIVAKVAPAAKILALDVFTKGANGHFAHDSDIFAAINWALNAKATRAFNVCAINLSLGSNVAYSAPCGGSPYEAAFAAARAAGIVPVVAAGNAALTRFISAPACAPSAVSVGAVYDAALGARYWSACTDAATAADAVACFSNSAPYLSLLAPGAIITAGGYSMGGTSQAAPHVAGAAAVLLGAEPGASADAVVAALRASGAPITDKRNGVTTSRLNVAAAVAALRSP
ncbi:MAG: peptidase S8/S53 domain-containing protein, partial [Monoraphidium minutum]